MPGRKTLTVAVLLIVTAVAVLIVTATRNTARYFLTIEEMQAMGGQAVGRDLTISGAVLGDTIVIDPTGPRVTFVIVQVPGDPQDVERAGGLAKVLDAAVQDPHAARVEVVYEDFRPDLLQHKAQPIIRGFLGDDGRFHADEVLLKCPSRYDEGIPDQTSSGLDWARQDVVACGRQVWNPGSSSARSPGSL
jgi:cytochrome c-type biogenesis protein CcmE